MRPAVPIVILPGHGMNASYRGPPDARVELGPQLVSALSRDELKAVIAHEIGHRELYHVERCWAAITLGYLAGGYGIVFFLAHWLGHVPLPDVWTSLALLGPLLGIGLAQAMRAWHEFEADAYAMRTYGVKLYRAAFLKVAQGHDYWLVRKRLQVMDWFEANGG